MHQVAIRLNETIHTKHQSVTPAHPEWALTLHTRPGKDAGKQRRMSEGQGWREVLILVLAILLFQSVYSLSVEDGLNCWALWLRGKEAGERAGFFSWGSSTSLDFTFVKLQRSLRMQQRGEDGRPVHQSWKGCPDVLTLSQAGYKDVNPPGQEHTWQWPVSWRWPQGHSVTREEKDLGITGKDPFSGCWHRHGSLHPPSKL